MTVSDPLWVGVALIGGVGAVSRFVLDGVVSQWVGRTLPVGTFVINITGSFLLGVLTGLSLSGNALLLFGTAADGAFTTFSTWMLETHRLAEDGQPGLGVANAVVSLLIGFGAAALGRVVGTHA